MSDDEIKILQERLKNNPNDYVAIEQYAVKLSDIGENEESLKNFLFLNKKIPDNPKIIYNIGIILEKLKYFQKAAEAYEKSLSLDSNNTDTMYNLASVYIKLDKLDLSEKLLLKIIEKDKNDENAFFNLGEVYSRKKEHEKAIQYLTKALELDPKDIIAKFYLAYEYDKINRTETAIKLYEEVIQQNPDYSWAYFNLASIFLSQGNEELAISNLENTIKTNPGDLQAVKLLVKILAKNKKYTSAEKILKQYTVKMSEEADLYYLLAQVYKELKNHPNYLKYLKYTLRRKLKFSGNIIKLEEEIKNAENK